MKSKIFLFGLLVCSSIGFMQNIHFMKTYGNTGYDYGRDIEQDYDTGYVATGSSSSFTSSDADAFILKIDSLGNFVWSRNYGGAGSDWGLDIDLTLDSGYAVCGYTNSFGYGGFDFYLIKTNIAGDVTWEKTYGGSDWDMAYKMVQLPDSGFVIVGETQSFGLGGLDAFVVRTNKMGDTLWTKTFGDVADDYFRDVLLDGDSLVFVGGTKNSVFGMTDGLIVKTDLDFNIGWTKILGSANDDYFNTIDQFSNYYVCGGTSSYNFNLNKKDMWVYKTYDNGTPIYGDIYWDSPQDEEINGLFVHPLNQDIYYGGYTKSWGYTSDEKGDIFLCKFGSSWFFVNSVTYGEKGVDNSYTMTYCKDKGFITIGDMEFTSTGGNNIVIIKYNFSFEHIDIFTELQNDIITLNVDDDFEELDEKYIYPNPVTDFLNLTNLGLNIKTVTIYSIDGSVVFQSTFSDELIDLRNLKSGYYLLNVIDQDGKLNYYKFTKV